MPTGKAGKKSARVMTTKLSGGSATTRFTLGYGKSKGPERLAISGTAIAAITDDREQSLVAQTAPKAKVRALYNAGSDESCCERDSLDGLSFANASTVNVIYSSANDDGDASWSVLRLTTAKGKKVGSGARDSEKGNSDALLTATSLASDGRRDVVLAANDTQPFGVYQFAP